MAVLARVQQKSVPREAAYRGSVRRQYREVEGGLERLYIGVAFREVI